MTGTAEILIIDKTPEHAEEINSLLRNAGLNVHVHCASSAAEAKNVLQATRPLILVCNESAFQCIPAAQLFDLAKEHALLVALRLKPDDGARLAEVLAFSSCLVINSNSDSQLIDTVTMLVEKVWTQADLQNSKARMEELENRYHLLLDSSKEATAYLHEGLHVYANPAYLALLHAEDFAAIETLSLIELANSADHDLKKLLREMGHGNFPGEPIEVQMQPPEGPPFAADLDFSPARFDGEACIQMRVRQRDAQAQLKDELARLRTTDPLTQLSNRPHFIAGLEQFIQSKTDNGSHSAVLYFEPDAAGEIQSRLGIDGFDQIISELADMIRESIKEEELAARFSDQGIAVLAMRENAQAIRALAESIVRKFSKAASELENEKEVATCSAGLSAIGTQTLSAEEAISQARAAFSEATRTGGSIASWKPPLVQEGDDGDGGKWAEKIRYALNNNEFFSLQQSVVNLEGESEGLFENKTFMRSEDQDVSTEAFMPFAERNDLGAAIDRHVIPGLMKAIAGTGDRHIINVSENSIQDFSFSSWLQHQLEELGVEGSQLIMQVSARTAAANIKPCTRLIEEMRGVGCEFSISEFDDQRCNSDLLTALQVGWVKLRSGLAPALANNSAHQAIIRNVVAAAEQASVQVIADEVRDAADLAVLWQCGVKLVSGEFLKESPKVVGQ